MLELYDYQERAVSVSLEFINQKFTKDLLIQIPTGGGKSVVIYMLALALEKMGLNTLIITPRTRLVTQNARYFDDIGICSGSLGNDCFGEERKIIIGTFQTLIKREHNADILLIDEAHLIPEDELSAFNAYLLNLRKPIIGFTATPFRDNQPIFGRDEQRFKVGLSVDIIELIERGILVPPKTFSLSVGKEFISFKDYVMQALPKINQTLIHEGRSHPLFFFSTIAQAEIAAMVACKIGMNVQVVHSKIKTDFSKIESAFNEQNVAIFSVNQLTTGIDLPSADAIICFRKITSLSLWIQIIGRGLRKAEGKINCLVLDFGGNSSRFGALDNLLSWDLATCNPGKTPYVVCQNCGFEQPAKNHICGSCGCSLSQEDAFISLMGRSSDFELISKIKIAEILDVDFKNSAFKTDYGMIKVPQKILKRKLSLISILITKEGLNLFKKEIL